MHDLSTNGTYILDKRVGKNKELKIENGDVIYLLHKTKVDEKETIGFVIKLKNTESNQNKTKELEELKSENTKIHSELKKLKDIENNDNND